MKFASPRWFSNHLKDAFELIDEVIADLSRQGFKNHVHNFMEQLKNSAELLECADFEIEKENIKLPIREGADVNLSKIRDKYGYSSVSVGLDDYGFKADVHAPDAGEFGCALGSGKTAEEAIRDAINKAKAYAEKYDPEAERAKKIAKLKAELAALEGEAA